MTKARTFGVSGKRSAVVFVDLLSCNLSTSCDLESEVESEVYRCRRKVEVESRFSDPLDMVVGESQLRNVRPRAASMALSGQANHEVSS